MGPLANFPMPPEDEELLDDGHNGAPAIPGSQGAGTDASTARYPVRQMMQLIENVAAKQTCVLYADWTTWCIRLEQCLIQMKRRRGPRGVSEAPAQPDQPLVAHAVFARPSRRRARPAGSLYEGSLRRIEAEWNVSAFARLGGPQ